MPKRSVRPPAAPQRPLLGSEFEARMLCYQSPFIATRCRPMLHPRGLANYGFHRPLRQCCGNLRFGPVWRAIGAAARPSAWVRAPILASEHALDERRCIAGHDPALALPCMGMKYCGVYSGLMLAARITLPHFSVSSTMSLPNSADEPVSTVPPRSTKRISILESARLAFVSRLSLPMI